jgi:2-iminobutanoate/2-iminopropanoate deaminase
VKEIVQPRGASRPRGAWSQGVRAGDLLFVAGQVGEDENGVITHPDDIEVQADLALANVLGVVRAAGGDIANIVKITAFITDREDFAGYDAARRRFFGGEFPASSTVIVAGLVQPDYLLEVEAVAFFGAGG